MIVFEDARDRELLAELKEAGLVTPITLEAICEQLGSRDEVGLSEFLLAGADLIDVPEWLMWMIRHHGCYRFGPVRLAAGLGPESWSDEGPGEFHRIVHSPNLPYARLPVPAAGRAASLIGVLRPDYPIVGLPAAATLPELRELRRRWKATFPLSPGFEGQAGRGGKHPSRD